MEKTNYTPGPWTARDDDGTGTLPCVLSDKVNAGGNFYVAQCNVFEDARLIAAAPNLLKMLKEAKIFIRTDWGLRNEIEAAIARAEGLKK